MASGDGFSRPYVPRPAAWHFRQRQARRERRMGHEGYPIRVEQIAHREHLYHCWQKACREGGQAPGADGYTYGQFSPSEVGQIVGDLSEQVLSGVYFSEDVREVRIPKGVDPSKYRTLRLGTLCDRVLGRAVDRSFKGFWNARFLSCSYGFRPELSTWHLLADLEAAMRRTGMRVLAVDDIQSAFDNVPLARLVGLHAEALESLRQAKYSRKDRERTLALVEVVLRGPDKGRTRGIDQGGPYSPAGLNVLLHYHHDLLFKEINTESLPWRYADNLTYLSRSVSEGWQVLQAANTLLKPLGLALKGEDGVRDLSKGEETELLGFSLSWAGENLRMKITPKALEQLRQRLGETHATHNPPGAARVVAQGWVRAYAPAFEDGDVNRVLAAITGEGFREISLSLLQGWWKEAWARWLALRERSRRRRRVRELPRTSSPSPCAGFA